jgi:hypothetical protein
MRAAVALLALLSLAACERPPEKAVAPDPPARRDAASDAPVDARAVDHELLARLDGLAPRDRPPPPIVRKHRRGDCRADYAPRPERDPNPMCRVRGGTFVMGAGAPSPTVKAVPTTVADFDIDQFEVTSAQAVLFLNAHGNVCDPGLDVMNHPSQVLPCLRVLELTGIRDDGSGHYSVQPGRELDTAVFTWEGAMRYCAWVGKQVPTSAQWEYAARHDPDTGRDLAYPWGDMWLPRRTACRVEGCTPRPVPVPHVGPRDLPIGSFDGTRGRQDGSSPWGVHDTAGGAGEVIFECDDPNATCSPGGQPCPCRKLNTSNGGATSRDELHVTHRFDHTDLNNGSGAARCARLRHPH